MLNQGRKKASLLQAIDHHQQAFVEENDRMQKQVSQLVYENDYV